MTYNPAQSMLAGQLLPNEILDPKLLQAMGEIPRQMFVPEHLSHAAYADRDLAVGRGRFLLAPLTFARLLDMAKIAPDSRVLVVGALSGYAAAVAAQLSGRVTAVENDPALAERMQDNLMKLGVGGVAVKAVASLAEGYPPGAPYDAVVICGGVATVPDALASQLALNGILTALRVVAPRPGRNGGMGRGFFAQRLERHLYSRETFDAPATLLPGFDAFPAASAF